MSFDLKVLSVLGQCEGISGGRVRLAKERSPSRRADNGGSEGTSASGKSRLFVLKTYNLEDAKSQSEFHDMAECIANEAVTMSQFKHANVLTCLASYVSGHEVILVVPYLSFGSVRDLLDKHFTEGLPETAIAFIVRDVLQALHYLHSKGIVHRSVRASHILLSDSGSARLSGLRYSCSLVHSGYGLQDRYDYPLHVAKTNLNWLSPEFLQQNLLGYNERTDIYSLGVTICETANGMVPFSEMPATLMLLEKLRGAAPKLIDSSTIQQQQDPAGFSSDMPADSGVGASVGSCTNMTSKDSVYARRSFTDAVHDFVENCSYLDAAARPSAAALLSHPFIKQLKKSSLSLASILESLKAQADATLGRETDGDESVEDLQELSLDGGGDWDF